jgi:hypothetical protein
MFTHFWLWTMPWHICRKAIQHSSVHTNFWLHFSDLQIGCLFAYSIAGLINGCLFRSTVNAIKPCKCSGLHAVTGGEDLPLVYGLLCGHLNIFCALCLLDFDYPSTSDTICIMCTHKRYFPNFWNTVQTIFFVKNKHKKVVGYMQCMLSVTQLVGIQWLCRSLCFVISTLIQTLASTFIEQIKYNFSNSFSILMILKDLITHWHINW